VDYFDDLLAGRQTFHHISADSALPHAGHEFLHHLEMDVGL
jgi:hypothetical protein